MFVIFEGLDKSGKGTLEREFLKATNYKHIVIDRGPVGYMVFDKLFDRQSQSSNFAFARDAAFAMDSGKFMVVYCVVPEDVALQRIAEHNETCPYNYGYAQKVYDAHIDALYSKYKVVVVDTTLPVEQCVDMILQKFQEVFEK
ncbi:MAG: hypothetical protein IKK92_09655 [Prevotella sp.]|nr:hypothetical protein [Prevotella sp.]